MDSELLATLIEAISALNQRANDLEVENDGTKKEINDFQGEYAKEVKLLQKQIDEISVQIDRLIREAIKEIPQAKDGVNGKDYDETVAKALLKAEINKLVKSRNLETEKIKSEVLQAVSEIEVPKAKDGIDGKSATGLQVQNAVNEWIDANYESLKGEDGKSIQGAKGDSGEDGSDGISIVNAEMKGDYLVLTFSDDTEKRVKLPKQRVLVGGGGTIEDRTDLIITATQNTYLSAQSQTILCDATNENINIKLPRPSSCFNSGRSFRIVFTRKDITENIVTITPYGTELILNELSQDLLSREVINLITDGINWYYAA